MHPLLEFRNVACAYTREPVLFDINLRIEPGQFVGLVGPSGSGKTTLLRAALGLVRPVAGTILFDGRPLAGPPPRVGYVPQVETVDWTFPVTAMAGNVPCALCACFRAAVGGRGTWVTAPGRPKRCGSSSTALFKSTATGL